MRTILDVADVLFGEKGYEATTLKAVSERSGIPIASIYHYFEDRNQLEIALLQRHSTQLEERLGTVWSGRSAPRSLRKAVDVMIDGYLSHFRGHPGCFVELWFCGRNPAISDMALAFDRKQAEQLRGLALSKSGFGRMCHRSFSSWCSRWETVYSMSHSVGPEPATTLP
ncbi:TetR/AcrR family transcriptional regulator [Nocardia violaceofusca]|uniref:TetR/AcrR family transcriptional regulator n=1 Tax=Nocardia violaceofusca TaxID=941182 RepID=UPI0018DD1C79|nr:TetR/AcrR family transcriptional regulator [Nocardia violaceofusca]